MMKRLILIAALAVVGCCPHVPKNFQTISQGGRNTVTGSVPLNCNQVIFTDGSKYVDCQNIPDWTGRGTMSCANDIGTLWCREY